MKIYSEIELLKEQEEIIERYMINYINGIECWHPRHDARTTEHYIALGK